MAGANQPSEREVISKSLCEAERLVGGSFLAMMLVDMLYDYLDANDQVKVDEACTLLDAIPAECEWAVEHFDEVLDASAEHQSAARRTVCDVLIKLKRRFGSEFSKESAMDALTRTLPKWSKGLKADLLKDAGTS